MSAEETSEDQGGGLLGSLLAPLRLPERVLDALDGLAESVRDLGPMSTELTRIRKQTAPLAEVIPTLERMDVNLGAKVGALHDDLESVDGRLANVERTVAELGGDVRAIKETFEGVKEDIQRVTGLRGERGVVERTRDLLTGGEPRKQGEEPEQS